MECLRVGGVSGNTGRPETRIAVRIAGATPRVKGARLHWVTTGVEGLVPSAAVLWHSLSAPAKLQRGCAMRFWGTGDPPQVVGATEIDIQSLPTVQLVIVKDPYQSKRLDHILGLPLDINRFF